MFLGRGSETVCDRWTVGVFSNGLRLLIEYIYERAIYLLLPNWPKPTVLRRPDISFSGEVDFKNAQHTKQGYRVAS
jgi:hypothetical protein